MQTEPGFCDICEKWCEHTAKAGPNSMRVCDVCGKLTTINTPSAKRNRSSEDHRKEKFLRLNNSKWMAR